MLHVEGQGSGELVLWKEEEMFGPWIFCVSGSWLGVRGLGERQSLVSKSRCVVDAHAFKGSRERHGANLASSGC